MEFVLWSARVVHVLSAVVWVGGLVYCNAILNPVLEHERLTRERWMQIVNRRMMGYVWLTLWPLLVTGVMLMLLHPKFRWGDYDTTFNQLLALKQVSFFLMSFFSWQTKKVFENMSESSENAETFEGWRLASIKLLKRTIFSAILAVLAAEGMRSF
jgi:uncharacterized membrane protein